jgi:hypothetical protein
MQQNLNLEAICSVAYGLKLTTNQLRFAKLFDCIEFLNRSTDPFLPEPYRRTTSATG